MIQRFPQNREIREQRIRLLCELGLFQHALDLALQDLRQLSTPTSLSSSINEDQILVQLPQSIEPFVRAIKHICDFLLKVNCSISSTEDYPRTWLMSGT